jgi:hypothetical protein
VPWVETSSESFAARHDAADAAAVGDLLERLEGFRSSLEEHFVSTPAQTAVVIHPSTWQLALARPWMPLARLVTAPAGRRYLTGWSGPGEIHVLSPAALEARASAVPGSRQALLLSAEHEYAHLVVAAHNPHLPPPFTGRRLQRYARWAWLTEGAATFFSGQVRFLRPALARRLREGPALSLPPSPRDAQLLGGTVLSLLERGAGIAACVELATQVDPGGPRVAIERAFARGLDEVQDDWRRHVAALAAG